MITHGLQLLTIQVSGRLHHLFNHHLASIPISFVTFSSTAHRPLPAFSLRLASNRPRPPSNFVRSPSLLLSRIELDHVHPLTLFVRLARRPPSPFASHRVQSRPLHLTRFLPSRLAFGTTTHCTSCARWVYAAMLFILVQLPFAFWTIMSMELDNWRWEWSVVGCCGGSR